MKEYKPEYLGKVLPDDQKKLNKFMHNKFDAFSKIYDTCKKSSDSINDIKTVETSDDNSSTLTVKVSVSDSKTLDKISDTAKNKTSVEVSGDTITANSK